MKEEFDDSSVIFAGVRISKPVDISEVYKFLRHLYVAWNIAT